MKFNKISPLAFLLTLAVVGAGCGSSRSLVGKWTTTSQGQTQTVEFTSDSKMLVTMDVKQPVPMTGSVTGTYTLDKDTFSVKATDLTLKAGDASKQALIDTYMSSGKQKMLDDINKAGSNNKLAWKTDDQFVVTDSAGKAQTFDRVKS